MQIKITFLSDDDIILPIHYNSILQGFIYKNIDGNLSNFLHESGYLINNRTFKLFAFSRILTKGRKDNRYLNFGKTVEFMVSSSIDKFCKSIVNNMIISEKLFLGKNIVKVSNVEMVATDLEKDEIIVSTLSGIVTYSTLTRADGRKYTNYYKSYNKDFERIIKENLLKKYEIIHGYRPENCDFSIKLLGEESQNLVYYKDTIIKGISGKFMLKGDKKLLKVGLDTGLGSKNSQGFGMIRELKRD